MPTPEFDDAVLRIRAALAVRPPRLLDVPGFRASAVLVPILDRPRGPSVLFTRRSERLLHHRGEISFPGGRLEAGEGPVEAALREAHEEIGLDPAASEVLGRLDDLPSVAGYVVTPVAAAVRSPPDAFTAQESEVDEHFEVPLARLLDPGLRRSSLLDPAELPPRIAEVVSRADLTFEDVDPQSGHWRVWSFHADETRVVWGLTARILADLLDRAFAVPRRG